ncbi:MAG: class I SAM-dependent methyltransferase, partial [Candidatus Latescibacteria bacterium]|nr:class I SAM-dependent methyltransferase [Candidatus Latescibacterota bacterium]
MLNYLKQYYLNQQFYPTFIGLFINPFYIARKGLVNEIASLSMHISGRVLDVGCGNKPYEKLFNSDQYIGLEIDTPENRRSKKADMFYNGMHIPAENKYFDGVVAFQVFEHVFNPEDFLIELRRVLKQGGKLLMTIPFVWDEHEQPHDFAR